LEKWTLLRGRLLDPRAHLGMMENSSTMFLDLTRDTSSIAQSIVIILTQLSLEFNINADVSYLPGFNLAI